MTTRRPLGKIKGIRPRTEVDAAGRHLRPANPDAHLSPALIRAVRATRAARASAESAESAGGEA